MASRIYGDLSCTASSQNLIHAFIFNDDDLKHVFTEFNSTTYIRLILWFRLSVQSANLTLDRQQQLQTKGRVLMIYYILPNIFTRGIQQQRAGFTQDVPSKSFSTLHKLSSNSVDNLSRDHVTRKSGGVRDTTICVPTIISEFPPRSHNRDEERYLSARSYNKFLYSAGLGAP